MTATVLKRVALMANKVRGEEDLEAVREFAASNELEIGGIIPFDDRLQGAERAGQAPFDFDPDAPAVAAIEKIALEFVEGVASGNGAAAPAGDIARP